MTFSTETKNQPDLFSHIFADNLKRYMEAYNISTNGVAVKTGVSQKTLWVTVNRKNVPTLDSAKKICDALGVDFGLCTTRVMTPRQVQSSKKIARALATVLSSGVGGFNDD